jgi:RHS repeat-associated protein
MGTLTGSADYDAFGAVRGTSTVGSLFGFTGEQTDAETGFVHLRARSYDPSLGRFLSVDTVQPNAPGTQGFNRYGYVAGNPTTLTDPSGHSALGYVISHAVKVVLAYTMTGWCSSLQSFHFDYIAQGSPCCPGRRGP